MGEIDAFEWFCDRCDALVLRRECTVEALADDVKSMIEAWAADEDLRKCPSCGHLNPATGDPER